MDVLPAAERLIAALASVVTILAGLAAGVAWSRHHRRTAQPAGAATGAAAAEPAEAITLPVFAPWARVEGPTESFVDRTRQVRRLVADVRGNRSVVLIEGLPGIGKTVLAAALCARLARRRRIGRRPYRVCWTFCAERRDLSLERLALSLAEQNLPGRDRVRVAVRPAADPIDLIDALIGYLARNRILLVLDDYHRLEKSALAEFVDRLAHSRTRSTAVLTSRRHPEELRPTGLTDTLAVEGLPRRAARAFLRKAGVREPAAVLDAVWAKAGYGVPEAMKILVGLSSGRSMPEALRLLPAYESDLRAWMATLLAELGPAEEELARIVSFAGEPVRQDLLAAVVDDPSQLEPTLSELVARRILSQARSGEYDMHPLWRDHLRTLIDSGQRLRYGSRIAKYYQRRARDLLRGVAEEPSYGELYLESFPDYVGNEAGHARLVDDLMGCLREHRLQPEPGARVLVLGAGTGIHDPGLARHSYEVVNLDLLVEVAALGLARARSLPAPIRYLAADMTRPLPFQSASFDAVVNLGSSFGFEDADEDNAAMFRHAARVLKPGRPFMFEYANGGYWREYERTAAVTALDGGGIRTNYKIVDPGAGTSLNVISLQRPGRPARYFHHFMHYYRLDEVLAMMNDAGLEPVATYGAGDFRVRGPFDPERSAAMVVIAVRQPAG